MMDTVSNNNKKRPFAAVDLFIILLLLLSVGGVALRAFWNGGLYLVGKTDDYYVSYIITGAKSEINEYFTEDKQFYTENGELFGSVTGDVISTPAKIYIENSKGEYVAGYTTGSDIDIKGTFAVSGKMGDKGFICGGQYLCANMTLKVVSAGVSTDILVTDISKAS